jgi:hypothetical protein
MKRPILTAILLCAVLAASVATAAVTVVLTGPATYADAQWRSVTINNKNGGATFNAIIEICPSSSNPAVPGACSTTQIEVGSLPASAQTIVNYMITQWCTAHAGYCT